MSQNTLYDAKFGVDSESAIKETMAIRNLEIFSKKRILIFGLSRSSTILSENDLWKKFIFGFYVSNITGISFFRSIGVVYDEEKALEHVFLVF